jgi:putative oxidoreductase
MRQNDWKEYVRSVLRIVAGLTFSLHGCQKLFGMFGGMGGHGATAHMWSQFWVAGVLEAVGGALLLLGLFTRPVAFLLCGEMAVAYFGTHFPRAFWPIQNGGELAVLYCFVFLYLMAAGGGPISLDHALRRKFDQGWF